MPLYMDHHRKMFDVPLELMVESHKLDVAAQQKHGVSYKGFWLDPKDGHMFCLVEAPSREALADLHRETHGLVPMEIYEVFDHT